MKELVVRAWCDPCAHELEQQTEATQTVPLSINMANPWELDLCELHHKRLVTPLAELLAEKGRPHAASQRPARSQYPSDHLPRTVHRWTCPVCSDEFNRGSALTHVYKRHRTDSRPAMTTCPDCKATFDSASKCGSHRARSHGWDALAEALAGVK